MEEYLLSEAAVSDDEDVRDMLREIGPGAYGFSNDAFALSSVEFKHWIGKQIDSSNGINLENGLVPQTTFWLRRNGYPIGFSRLRHKLNQALLVRGGNIGFCIRPTERGKNLALLLLNRTLAVAKQMGMREVLLTCDTENIGSWKTIEKCGGILEKTENGWRHYWIE
jgi:predicted acetyltransferase